jgi:hypothetical protein
VRLADLRGAIVWAVTPYVAEAPFRILAGTDIRTYASAEEIGTDVRRGELPAEQTHLVRSKLRPVVVLQDRPLRRLPEFAALRLVRLEALEEAHRERVRRQEEPSLFYLPVRARYGLSKENAVDLNSLVRVHGSSMVGNPVGRISESDLRTIGERLVTHLDLDVSRLVERRLVELRQRLVERRSGDPRS